MILDVAECDGARLARDPSYDGRFFTGVCTTGRLLRPNSLNFGLVFVVGLKPPRSPQPGRAPVRRLIGRCILSGIRREARGLEGDQECYRNRCAPLRGSHLTLRWRGVDSNFQFRARWATISKLCPRPARSAIGAGVSSEQLLASPNTPTKSSWTDSGVPALSSRPLVDSNSVTFMSR